MYVALKTVLGAFILGFALGFCIHSFSSILSEEGWNQVMLHASVITIMAIGAIVAKSLLDK